MKMISQILFCFLLCSLFACKRAELTTLEGRVVQCGTLEPIEGAFVDMVDGVSTNSFAGSTSTRGQSKTVTDSNGYFKVQLEATGDVWLGVSNGDASVYSNERRLDNLMGGIMNYPRGQHTKDILVEMGGSGVYKLILINRAGLSDTTLRKLFFTSSYNHKLTEDDSWKFIESPEIFNIYNAPYIPLPYRIEYYVDDVLKVHHDTAYTYRDSTVRDTFYYFR